MVLIALPNFPSVALLASITTLVPYGAAALALLVLRRTDPTTERPFRLPGAWVLTPASFVVATVLIYWASWPWTLLGVFLTLIGVPLYFLFTSASFRHWARIGEMTVVVGGLALVGLVMVYDPWSHVDFSGTSVYLNGLPALPVIGTAVMFIGIPLYFVTLLFRRATYAESKSVLWIVAYLGGLGVISYLGDQFFIYENFLQPTNGYPVTIEPMGLLTMPWDIVVLVAFGLAMFLWGFFSALRRGTPITAPSVALAGSEPPAPSE